MRCGPCVPQALHAVPVVLAPVVGGVCACVVVCCCWLLDPVCGVWYALLLCMVVLLPLQLQLLLQPSVCSRCRGVSAGTAPLVWAAARTCTHKALSAAALSLRPCVSVSASVA